MTTLSNQVQAVFREVFADEALVLQESTTAADIEGWDSLMHINLIVALEKRFGVRFATSEIARLKADGQTIGSLIQMLAGKTGGA